MSHAAHYVIECLSTVDALDPELSVEEPSKAIDSLTSAKAPYDDRITPDLITNTIDYLTVPTARSHLPVLVRRSCTTGPEVHQYHYPVLEQWQEKRLQQLQRHLRTQHCRHIIRSSHTDTPPEAGGGYLPETPCGFRAERSAIDMVFSLRQLQEKCREQQIPFANGLFCSH